MGVPCARPRRSAAPERAPSGAPDIGIAEVDGEVAEGAARVDDFREGRGGDGGGDFGKAFAEGGGVGGGGLDFAGVEASGGFEKEVDFDSARGVAVEPQVGVESAVEAVLAGFGDDEILEEAADEGVGGHLGFVADADEPGGVPAHSAPPQSIDADAEKLVDDFGMPSM